MISCSMLLFPRAPNQEAFNTGLFDESDQTLAAARASGEIAFAEEESWNYEGGLKTTVFDGRATFNMSGYYIDWSNQALTQIIEVINRQGASVSAPILVNLGKTEIWGGEIESNWAATDNVNLGIGYGSPIQPSSLQRWTACSADRH